MARFFASVIPPLPFNPATRRVSSGSPACGTSFISSPRSVPTSTTSRSAPRESHSCAMAIAGKTWPPVPPPATKSFMTSCVGCLLRNVQQHSRRKQHHQQTRTAVTDERQWDAFRRHDTEHDRKVDQRLRDNQCSDAESQESAEIIGRIERCAQAAPAVDGEKRDDQDGANEANLFADDRVDEVRMCFGQVEELLLALHQTHAC